MGLLDDIDIDIDIDQDLDQDQARDQEAPPATPDPTPDPTPTPTEDHAHKDQPNPNTKPTERGGETIEGWRESLSDYTLIRINQSSALRDYISQQDYATSPHPHPSVDRWIDCMQETQATHPDTTLTKEELVQAYTASGMRPNRKRALRLAREPDVIGRCSARGVDVLAIVTGIPADPPRPPPPPDDETDAGEIVPSYSRDDIISEIERTLAHGRKTLTPSERLSYMDRLTKLKGYDKPQEADQRPPEPCLVAEYISSWAGHGGRALRLNWPDGDLRLVRRILEFTGYTARELYSVALRVEGGEGKDLGTGLPIAAEKPTESPQPTDEELQKPRHIDHF